MVRWSGRPAAALLLAGAYLVTVAAQSPSAPHGAYLGCFDLSKLEGVKDMGEPARFTPASVRKCAAFCRGRGAAFNAITSALACHCTAVVPPDGARLSDKACGAKGRGKAAALFYNHANVDSSSCRLANVEMKKDSFAFHYNDYHASFDDGLMTLTMEGSNGLRFTTNDGKHMYGVFQVTGKTTSASGAVTAFYTRSSDDYNTGNHGDFDEIDFEFLNGNPSVPAGLWLNSFHKGLSGGERLVKPEEYRPVLKLAGDQDAGTTFLTYTINWQPDQVTWHANNKMLLRRHYGEEVSWKDMKGEAFSRSYRPPAAPQLVTFSMWSDQDQNRAFGGKLDWAKSPFKSYFRDLRRVLCDRPADTASNGPAWAYPAVPAGGPAGSAPNATADSLMPEAGAVAGRAAKASHKASAQQQQQQRGAKAPTGGGAKPAAHGDGKGKRSAAPAQRAPAAAQQPKPQGSAAQRA